MTGIFKAEALVPGQNQKTLWVATLRPELSHTTLGIAENDGPPGTQGIQRMIRGMLRVLLRGVVPLK